MSQNSGEGIFMGLLLLGVAVAIGFVAGVVFSRWLLVLIMGGC